MERLLAYIMNKDKWKADYLGCLVKGEIIEANTIKDISCGEGRERNISIC